MTTASLAAAGNANSGSEGVFRRSGRSLPPSVAIARVARKMWPTKTDKELAVRTRTSDRTCRELLAERGGLSLDAVANLLKSEEGQEFLDAILGEASPVWRQRLARGIAISKMRDELEAQRKRIEQYERTFGQLISD